MSSSQQNPDSVQCLAALPNQQTSPKPSTLTKGPGLFSEITAFFLIQTAVVLGTVGSVSQASWNSFKELMFESPTFQKDPHTLKLVHKFYQTFLVGSVFLVFFCLNHSLLEDAFHVRVGCFRSNCLANKIQFHQPPHPLVVDVITPANLT